MLPSVAVGQRRVEQAIALSAEPPIPRCLRNPYSGYWPGHSSAASLAGTGDSSKRDWEEWVLWRGWFDTVPFDRLRAGFPRTLDRLTTNGGASVWELRGRRAGLRRRPYARKDADSADSVGSRRKVESPERGRGWLPILAGRGTGAPERRGRYAA